MQSSYFRKEILLHILDEGVGYLCVQVQPNLSGGGGVPTFLLSQIHTRRGCKLLTEVDWK